MEKDWSRCAMCGKENVRRGYRIKIWRDAIMVDDYICGMCLSKVTNIVHPPSDKYSAGRGRLGINGN